MDENNPYESPKVPSESPNKTGYRPSGCFLASLVVIVGVFVLASYLLYTSLTGFINQMKLASSPPATSSLVGMDRTN